MSGKRGVAFLVDMMAEMFSHVGGLNIDSRLVFRTQEVTLMDEWTLFLIQLIPWWAVIASLGTNLAPAPNCTQLGSDFEFRMWTLHNRNCRGTTAWAWKFHRPAWSCMGTITGTQQGQDRRAGRQPHHTAAVVQCMVWESRYGSREGPVHRLAAWARINVINIETDLHDTQQQQQKFGMITLTIELTMFEPENWSASFRTFFSEGSINPKFPRQWIQNPFRTQSYKLHTTEANNYKCLGDFCDNEYDEPGLRYGKGPC